MSEDIKPWVQAAVIVLLVIAGFQWFGLIITPGGLS